jgi:ESS family glutamate:Na+ symporter
MTLSPWIAVALSLPVLIVGERVVGRVRLLGRFNIPAPVVGGLLVSLLVLSGNVTGLFAARFETGVSAPWWTWLVCAGPEWAQTPVKNVNQPFLVAFFACIGLNASWTLVKRGSMQVLLLLGLVTAMAVIQNVVGVGLAGCLGFPRALGLMCGSVAMTGGHGTVMGFAPEFEAVGLTGAAVMGVAAATFGLVSGGLIGGPVGGSLIRKYRLFSAADAEAGVMAGAETGTGLVADLRGLFRFGKSALTHLLLLFACIKLGAWVSLGIQRVGITFPVYMGAMVLGVVARNLIDHSQRPWIRTEIVDTLSSVMLGVFLTIAMMSLNLIELAGVAQAMLVILAAQVAVMAVYARFITFKVMGGDYDAAVMAAGHCGFGLGAMPNAVANMKAVAEKYGHAPRAFLVVPITGTFLIDLINATNITVFINWLK